MNSILRAVCFQDYFQIVEKGPSPSASVDYVESRTSPLSQKEIGGRVLEAHRALARLSEVNQEQFRDVIEMLEGDLSRELSSPRTAQKDSA